MQTLKQLPPLVAGWSSIASVPKKGTPAANLPSKRMSVSARDGKRCLVR
jgi:hypothetical protein